MEDFVLRLGDQLDPVAEIRTVHVAQPDGQRAAHLVAVAGSDAAHGGADRLAAGTLLVQEPIFLDVPGEDHVRPIAQDQVRIHLDAAAYESVDLGQQGGGIQHHAAGDHALDLGPEDAAGHQRELEGLAPADHGMPGVGAALVADHDIVPFGQEVDDLAFGLVAPLQADYASSRHREGPQRFDFRRFPNAPVYQRHGAVVKSAPSSLGSVGNRGNFAANKFAG